VYLNGWFGTCIKFFVGLELVNILWRVLTQNFTTVIYGFAIVFVFPI
jgi:hypothetical protein